MLKEQNTSVCILKSDKASYLVGLKGGTLPGSTEEIFYSWDAETALRTTLVPSPLSRNGLDVPAGCCRSISPLLTPTRMVRCHPCQPLLPPVIVPSQSGWNNMDFTSWEYGLAVESHMKRVERTSLLQTPMPRQPQHPLPCVTDTCVQSSSYSWAKSFPKSISGKKHAGTFTVGSQEIQSSQIFILWPFTLKRVIEKTTATKTWTCTSLQ